MRIFGVEKHDAFEVLSRQCRLHGGLREEPESGVHTASQKAREEAMKRGYGQLRLRWKVHTQVQTVCFSCA